MPADKEMLMKFVYPIQGKSPQQLYELARDGRDGAELSALDLACEGGIHIKGPDLSALVIADGEVVAYRYISEYSAHSGEERPFGSDGFVLVRHEYSTPEGQNSPFFTCYAGLLPWSECTEAQKRAITGFGKPGYRIVNAPLGLNVRSSKVLGDNRVGLLRNGREYAAIREDDTWARITEGEFEGNFFCHHYGGRVYGEPVRIGGEPELDRLVVGSHSVKAGELIGYAGLEENPGGRGVDRGIRMAVFTGARGQAIAENIASEWRPDFVTVAADVCKHRWAAVNQPMGADFPDSPNVYQWNPVAFIARMQTLSEHLISLDMLRAAGAKGDNESLKRLLSYLNRFAEAYEIDTPVKAAHFLAQVGHESGFKVIEENLNYRAERMQQVFSTRKRDGSYKYRKLWEKPEAYARNPRALGSYVYANRMGNGGEASGEGYKYRGRGLIQLTGKNNYIAFTRQHNERFPDDKRDFVADPDLLVTDIKYGVESAFSWWTTNALNRYCTGTTREDVKRVTRKVNGGYTGLEDRVAKFAAVAKLMGIV